MKILNPSKAVLRGVIVLLLTCALLALTLLNSPAAFPGIYLPLVGQGWPTAKPYFSPLLISEVMANPRGEEPQFEWMEIYNRGELTLPLDSFKIGDAESSGDNEGMFRFTKDEEIASGEVVIVANNATAFFAGYGFRPDFELTNSDPAVPDMRKYSAWSSGSVNLSNGGDEVILLNEQDVMADEVSWGESVFAFNPSVRVVSEGNSIERKPADIDRNLAIDWIEQNSPSPGEVDLIPATLTPTTTTTPTSQPCNPATLLISEVLYDPEDSVDPDGEWVEVYNPGPGAVNLFCVKIGDEETENGGEGMYTFPVTATLPSGQVLVVAHQATTFLAVYGFFPDFEVIDSDPSVPDLLKYSPWASGSLNLSNSGDEAILLDGEDHIIDAVSWGSSIYAFEPPVATVGEGHSIERKPADLDTNAASDWIDQEVPKPGEVDLNQPTMTPTPTKTQTATLTLTPTFTPTPSETPPLCGKASLLISEVLYDPSAGGDPNGEWIEIYNVGEGTISLSCIMLGDEETAGGGEGMLTFPIEAMQLPGEVIVIANRATVFWAEHGFEPDFEMFDSSPSVPDMIDYPAWSDGSVNLSNSGDEIILLDEHELILDALSWGSSTFAFNPSVPTVGESHSLERAPADHDTDSAGDWSDQNHPAPGEVNLNPPTPTLSPTNTPTSTSTPRPATGLVINEIHADPDFALGDANGDGIVDSADDEFVEFVNNSGQLLDISDWTLNDHIEARHSFPEGTLLPAGCAVVVFGGGIPLGGFGNSLVQVASSGMLSLDQFSDRVILRDALGGEIAAYAYQIEAADNQSITRDPDIIGPDPLVKHSLANGSGGALFSPGTRVNGTNFSGCVLNSWAVDSAIKVINVQ